jgi:hypothetical protein
VITASRWYLIVGTCLILDSAWLGAQTAQPLPKSRTYVTAEVYQEGSELHFEHRGAATVQQLDGWQVIGAPVGKLIGLERRGAEGTDIRIFDTTGRQVGASTVPPGRIGVVTDRGIVTVAEALHSVVRPHVLGFYSLSGVLLRNVNEPNLSLVKWWPQRDGRMVTVSRGPGSDDRTIVVYGPDGRDVWRYAWKGPGYPDVAVTPDNQRLVMLQQDTSAGTTELTTLGPGNRMLEKQRFPTLYQMICSEDSRWIFAVGQTIAVVLDARSGKLIRRADEDIDFVLPGGLRFDKASSRLLIVAAKRDRSAGVSRLSLRSLDPDTGAVRRTALGEGPLDEAPQVLDVGETAAGERRVVLHDRVVDTPAEH